MSEDRTHHPYSPSTLQNIEGCPCFKGRDSQHARTVAGTLGHKVVETGEDDAKLGDDDAVAAAECLDFVETKRQELESEAAATLEAKLHEMGAAPADYARYAVRELKEVYLPIDECAFVDALPLDNGVTLFDPVKGTTAGYVDRILLCLPLHKAMMFDWKFGFWQVEKAQFNMQAIAYVLGLFKMFPELNEIEFYFKQPLIEYLTRHVFRRSDIPELYLRVQVAVARAREARQAGDFETAVAQVPVCNFCAHLGKCPKVRALAVHVAKKFYPLEFPEDVTPSSVMAPEQTTLCMKLAGTLKVWCDAFKRQVTDRVLRQEAQMPEGYTLQTREGAREITDLKKFEALALKYVDKATYEKALSASFGPIEEFISEQAPRGSKKARVEEFQKELVDAGVVTRGAPFSFLRVKSTKKED